MNTKVLVLSLGKGNWENKQKSVYREVNYRLGDSTEITTSPFVADVLMKEVKPDHILIIGTIKSAWEAFYRKYHNVERELPKVLNEIEEESLGKDTSLDVINDYEQRVEELFEKEIKIDGNPQIDVCMIQYGMNDAELNASYRKIRDALLDILKHYKQDEIEISFDITHSFRSLPIYNLVVLDYCRLLISRRIKIGHVYYGNLDVMSENNQIAQVVDLKNIVDILDITKGINEFLHTGNANTLLEINEGREDPFINALRDFNGAMQMNNRRKLQASLKELLQMNLENPEGDSDTLLDAKTTIQKILNNEFPVLVDNGETTKENQKRLAKFQLHLAGWCLGHGNVGIASVIAKEAFRSFLVAVYEQDVQQYENEKTRKRAEKLFVNFVDDNAENELLSRYKTIEKDARKIRNIFAHNLKDEDEDKLDKGEDEGKFNKGDASAKIEEYIHNLRQIMERYEEDDYKLMMIDNSQHVRSENNRIIFYIAETAPSYWQKKKLMKEDTDTYYFQIKVETQPTRKKIKQLLFILAIKLKEFLEDYKQEVTCTVVWGSDIYKKCIGLIHNAAPLIKSYCCFQSLNIYILKEKVNYKDGKKKVTCIEEQYIPTTLWKVDIDSEFDDNDKEEVNAELGSYKLVYLSETN